MQAPLPDSLASNQRFQVLGLLGRGFSGSVYRVHDREMGADVALKTLDVRDPDKLYRLKQEFRGLADIHHPNLVDLYELVVTPDQCFFTMELIEGVDLVEHFRSLNGATAGSQRLDQFVDAALQLVNGVRALHAAGKLHRDIKPPNILVGKRDRRVVLLDFGFATPLEIEAFVQPESTTVAGTLAYMAPEQLWGMPLASSSDWYSVGVVFYEALTGALPFKNPLAVRIGGAEPPKPKPLRSFMAEAPQRLDDLITAMLGADAGQRPSVDDIVECLQACQTAVRQRTTVPVDAERSPFVGRGAELEILREAFAASANRSPVVVQLHGSSGVGKSELVKHFLTEALSPGTLVLTGRCHPQEAVPYKAFDGLVDSLSRFLNTLPNDSAAAFAPRNPSALLRLFPILERVASFTGGPSVDGNAEPREVRRRGFAALRELLARLGDRHRLILWIDDIQWSDEDSAELIREVLRPPDPPVFLLILSYRSEDRASIALLPALQGSEGVATDRSYEIDLQPLTAEESRQLTLELVGSFSEDVDSVVAEAQGSPFFVSQLARHFRSRAADAQRQREASRLSLSTLMDAEMQELSPIAQEILKIVAVAGRPMDRSIVLESARAGERARPAVRRLEQDRLLRSVQVSGRTGIEVYHDRIRELVVAGLAPHDLRQLHRQLATSLTNQQAQDAEAVYGHWLGAGERLQAAEWALRAAARAESALAFSDAARLYSEALVLGEWDDARRHTLTVQRAEALVNAGRGADAGNLYMEASKSASVATEAIDLRRRAGEQLLLSGHLDAGTAVLRGLLVDLGIPYPRSTASVVVRTLVGLLRLRLGGFEPRKRPAISSAVERMELDARHSAAKGLALVDPFRGLYFATTTLLQALHMGDPERSARSLGEVGAALIPAGGALSRLAQRMLQRANEIAAVSSNPFLRAYMPITTAQQRMMEARWKEMLQLCDAGSESLRTHCRGVTWELDIGRMAAMRALEELGEIQELGQRADQLINDAEAAGDLYGTVTGLLMKGVAQIICNDPEKVRRLAQRTIELWTPGGFHLQHFYAFRLETYCDLYEGRSKHAWERLSATWPEIEKASLLRHALLRTDAYLLQARTALAVTQADCGKNRKALSKAIDLTKRLGRENRPDATAHEKLLLACIAAVGDNRKEAAIRLKESQERFAAVDMKLLAAVAGYRAAQLMTEEDRQTGAASANEYFRSQGIDPVPIARIYAPGFPN